MTKRPSDEYYRELETRLRALIPLAESVLSTEVLNWYMEYLDAGEYGLAVEVAAEGLPRDDAESRSREVAAALLAEAQVMDLRVPAVDRLRIIAEG
jgi:hypothetical protein